MIVHRCRVLASASSRCGLGCGLPPAAAPSQFQCRAKLVTAAFASQTRIKKQTASSSWAPAAPFCNNYSSTSSNSSSSKASNGKSHVSLVAVAAVLVACGGVSAAVYSRLHSDAAGVLDRRKSPTSSKPSSKKERARCPNTGRPLFTAEEVRAHNSLETGVWVTRGNGVYDITKFIPIHPGGERILLAAGGSIDPFWALFAIHLAQPTTAELLEEYRLGDLAPGEVMTGDAKGLENLFANDPARHPGLVVHSQRPCNAETPENLLAPEFVTPTEVFYVRNHLPVPPSDSEDAKVVAIDAGVLGNGNEIVLTVDDLRSRFPKVDVMVTLQCAGNRRSEMHAVKPVKGLQWGRGAIGNAVWSGARLSDVLAAASDRNHLNALDAVKASAHSDDELHVHLEGREGYGASIPLVKALSDVGDVIIAYEMNGEPIPADHGYPLRAIVPGHVAARSVKWLSKISVQEGESESHWQRRDYKGFGPSKCADDCKYEESLSIQEMPVQSAVLAPLQGEMVVPDEDRRISVSGYAWSGGGRGIVRVDVSPDGGKTWYDAQILHRPQQPTGRVWAWTRWETKLPLPADANSNKPIEIVCKAVDSSYNEQPERFESVYNVRGVLVSAWHRVKVDVADAQTHSSGGKNEK